MAVTTEMRTEVSQLYVALFGRAPDAEGLGFWTQQLADGASMTDVANSMYATDPARSYYPLWMTNAEIVTSFYENVLGRAPDDEGLAYWTAKMNAPGATPGSVIVDIIDVVANYTGTDPDGLESAALFANKVEAAQWYGEHDGGIENSSHFLSTITSDHSTVDAAIAAGVEPVPVFNLVADASAVDEGATVQFTLSTEHVLPGSEYAYTIEGVSAADVLGGSLSGTVIIDDQGHAVIERTLVADHLTEGVETMTVTLAGASASVTVNDTSLSPTLYVLTQGVDDLPGSPGDDTFKATQDTLNLGDSIDGADGNDRLEVSISGSGIELQGFASTSVETISVKSLSTSASTLDMSDTQGVTTIESIETEGASLTFQDIQSVEDTNIRIIDTDETHNFTYDANAYPGSGTVEIELQEIRGAQINFGDVGESLGSSEVDQIDITSLDRDEDQVTPATTNVVSALNVGDALEIVNITGNADLTVEDALDENIRLVNAGTLAANLTLNMTESNDDVGGVDEVTYTGAQGDDVIDFGDTSNDKDVTLGTGNDWVRTGTGEASVDGGAGNDTIFTGAQNDLVIAGDGDDVVYDAGATNDDPGRYVNGGNSFNLGAGNDYLEVLGAANNTVIAGSGNDGVWLEGAGNNAVNLGDGNDWLVIIGDGNNIVDAGSGDDYVGIYSNGSKDVTLGDGNDWLTVYGNGNVDATGGTGDDGIDIYGDGVHTIDLGAGNDWLYIDGEGDVDLTTTILGGDGNDTVAITENHLLDADLGAGDDSITLRARDLSSEDVVAGNADADTLVLTNLGGFTSYGRVTDSETRQTSGFETFDLRDSNIRLDLTDNLIETATNNDVTVTTQLADRVVIPLLTPINTMDPQALITQGMTLVQYQLVEAAWDADQYDEAVGNAWTLEEFLAQNLITVDFTTDVGEPVWFESTIGGAQTIDIQDITTPQYSFTLLGGTIRDIVVADDDSVNGMMVLNYGADDSLAHSVQDTLRVVNEATITTADLRNVTGLELIELVSTRDDAQSWVINLNDRVINQTTGSSTLVIHVDPNVAAGSTLYIELDPSVSAATNDVRIERNSNVTVYINGALVTEPQYGVTDFNPGPASIMVVSELLFTTNPDTLIGTLGADTFIATSVDQVQNSDFADGMGGFDTLRLDFAVANDADSLSEQLDDAQITGIERIEFNTGNNVSMDGLNWWKGGGLDLSDLEEVATGSGNDRLYEMGGDILYQLNDGDDLITILPSSAGSPTIDGGLGIDTVETASFDMGEDDHAFSIVNVEFVSDDDAFNDDEVTILSGLPASSQAPGGLVSFWNIENIYGSSDADNIFADSNGGPIWLYGNGGDDTLTVGGDSPSFAWVDGGTGNDTIDVTVDDWSRWWADPAAYVYGNEGDDVIDVQVNASGDWWWWGDSNNAYAYVDGGNGNDTITVQVGASNWWWWGATGSSSAQAYVYGGNGDDIIGVNVHSSLYDGYWWGDSSAFAWVEGGDGNDVIDVSVSSTNYYGATGVNASSQAYVFGNGGDDVIDVNVSSYDYAAWWWNDADASSTAYVDGGNGNDVIDVNVWTGAYGVWWDTSAVAYAEVYGGAGDDVIDVTVSASSWWWWNTEATAYVDGGTGDDDIFVDAQTAATIVGGAGDDIIDLAVHAWWWGNQDTLVFGTIDYNVLQQVELDTQGSDTITGFNFEWGGAGDEDLLDFTDFLPSVDLNNGGEPEYADWTAGTTTLDMSVNGSNVAVIEASAGFTLTAADISQSEDPIAGTLQIGGTQVLGAEGRTVVIVATDTNGTLGYETFDVYFVQDVDQDYGAAWQVDLVGQITSATEIGAITSVDAANFAT